MMVMMMSDDAHFGAKGNGQIGTAKILFSPTPAPNQHRPRRQRTRTNTEPEPQHRPDPNHNRPRTNNTTTHSLPHPGRHAPPPEPPAAHASAAPLSYAGIPGNNK